MSTARFFVEHLHCGCIRLSGDEARHAVRVRRLKIGDRVSLFDARGRQAEGTITAAARNGVDIQIERVDHAPPDPGPRLTLAVAPPKGPRGDWLIEKAAELGVASIWPMTTQRSIVAPREAKLDKWRRIARESNKQSGRAGIMAIEPLQPLGAVIRQLGEFDRVWLADPQGPTGSINPAFAAPVGSYAPTPSCGSRDLMLIGPEGGWSDDEHRAIVAGGARPVRLADAVLRVETAAVAAAVIWAAWRAQRVSSP